MFGSDLQLWLTPDLAPMGLLAYIGMGPGPEFIPYFMALLMFVGGALIATLQWPISVLLGYLSKIRPRQYHASRAAAANAVERFDSRCEATHERACR